MTDYTGIVFPPDHALNIPIDSLPVHQNSDNYISSMGKATALHPDFGTSWDNQPMGIPYNVVGAGQPKVPIKFVLYNDESDPGPWPIPKDPFIETVLDWRETADGDRHMLIVDSSTHILYESGNVAGVTDGSSWEGGCGAVFDLNGYKLRPDTWTSTDAAGLPIFPLLIRYDEVERALATGGELHHAIRFTASTTQKAYLWPARHYASSNTDKNRPPMGLRLRLKAAFDISGYTPRMRVILRTLKKYGFIMADNGSNWYFQGTNDERWDDDELSSLKAVHGSDFEAVDISEWLARPGFDINSGKVPSASGTTGTGSRHYRADVPFSIRQGTHTGTIEIAALFPTGSTATIRIFDASGKPVALLLDGFSAAVSRRFSWTAPGTTAPGIYFVRMQRSDGFTVAKSFTLLR
jgi:hypothetical protein